MAVDYRQGDYRVVAERLRPASAQLVEWCAPAAGGLVVDVGAGSGWVVGDEQYETFSRRMRAVAERYAGPGDGFVLRDDHLLARARTR